MVILGINGGFRAGYQDVSACLIENGNVIAAVEEERLNRIKFSPGRLPFLSVKEVLAIGNKKIEDVDLVAFHGSTWGDNFHTRISSYFESQFGYSPRVKQYHHHDCHAASTYYASGFRDSLILTLDNSGDGTSLQVSKGLNGNIEMLSRNKRPNSLGIFYSLITQYCGFVRDSDEYKLMGLSSFGDKHKFTFDWLIDFVDGQLILNDEYLVPFIAGQAGPHRDELIYSDAFISRIGKDKRIPHSELDKFYKDVAASAQNHLEQLMLKITLYYIEETGLNKVCLAGGAALNCVMNQKLMNCDKVDEIFIQPASGDAGISLGAAWLASKEHNEIPIPTKNTYLGRGMSNSDVESILKSCQVKYEVIEDAPKKAAELIADNMVIGWFQGKSEFGPRALGNRSILASPLNPEMRNIVNQRIKLRESFRPFCPSVLEEDLKTFFVGKQNIAPYMNITYDVNPAVKDIIPSALHVDDTARIQTVNSNQNKAFYELLINLKRITGYGIVLNTSYNLSHEPIVYSVRDALATFFSSGLDYLIVNDFLISK